MTNFFMLPEYLQYTVIFVNLIALVINIYSVVSCAIFEAHKKRIGINLILTGLNTALFYMFVSVNFANRKNIKGHSLLLDLFSKYGWAFMALLAVLSALSVLSLYLVEKWKREHITPASIKEGIDRLPAGLCYHNEKGVPKLINHRMDGLCRYITGEPLFDGNEFWRRLTKGEVLPGNTVVKWGENPIITLSDGNTLSFTKIEREIGGKKLYEIRATDITKQYALNLELQRNNNELRSLNTRLQEYGENVYDITREREILTAKVNIHDMLGKALLVTKRYIESGDEGITKNELTDMWKGTLYLFEGGFTEGGESGNLDELYDAAKLMGIRLTVKGQIPSDNRLLRFIMSGARESLTNAVHHAKASELVITLYREYSFFVIEYTNDGSKPANPVSEGGGLSSLRQSVESEGGTMETEIFPQFVLRLKIPSKEVSYV
ncbi:MAG: hypothetical protein UHM85_08825 [Acutalibacteraceae bacterium]|nr:hypothetical protein [Acutalibacteraceae bacterium]